MNFRWPRRTIRYSLLSSAEYGPRKSTDRMSKRPITIATAQSYISADVRENGQEIRRLMQQARGEGAAIIHFPEGALSGYTKSQIKNLGPR